MRITDFESFLVGSGFPLCFDIERLEYGSEDSGFVASTWAYNMGPPRSVVVQLLKKEKHVALVTRRGNDIDLPHYWEDAEVLWDSRKDKDFWGKESEVFINPHLEFPNSKNPKIEAETQYIFNVIKDIKGLWHFIPFRQRIASEKLDSYLSQKDFIKLCELIEKEKGIDLSFWKGAGSVWKGLTVEDFAVTIQKKKDRIGVKEEQGKGSEAEVSFTLVVSVYNPFTLVKQYDGQWFFESPKSHNGDKKFGDIFDRKDFVWVCDKIEEHIEDEDGIKIDLSDLSGAPRKVWKELTAKELTEIIQKKTSTKGRIVEIVEIGQPQSLIQRENGLVTELIKTDSLVKELNEQLRLHKVTKGN